MAQGKIILLNGVSSAGKTTLSKALQEKLETPYYWLSEDVFREMTPAKFDNEDTEENEWIWINAIYGMYRTARMYSDIGMNTIIDTVLDGPTFLDEAVELLHNYPILFVHVTCPLEELQKREEERGDREIGLAEELLPRLYPLDGTYDIVVDTYKYTVEECADRIMGLLGCLEDFSAFKRLKERMK
ncbi:MAG: chloramphenicol phosphotransferase CPT family protein [Turicibacter sp.]|nr:chloramphenicol phosphotransferase CPT family protein [Turicibacter sp.]